MASLLLAAKGTNKQSHVKSGWVAQAEREVTGKSQPPAHGSGFSLQSQNAAATSPPSEKHVVAPSRHPLKINSLLQDIRTSLHFSVAEEHSV